LETQHTPPPPTPPPPKLSFESLFGKTHFETQNTPPAQAVVDNLEGVTKPADKKASEEDDLYNNANKAHFDITSKQDSASHAISSSQSGVGGGVTVQYTGGKKTSAVVTEDLNIGGDGGGGVGGNSGGNEATVAPMHAQTEGESMKEDEEEASETVKEDSEARLQDDAGDGGQAHSNQESAQENANNNEANAKDLAGLTDEELLSEPKTDGKVTSSKSSALASGHGHRQHGHDDRD